MPLQQTSGNVTADAYGGGVAVVPAYIEEVFSTYLYTGNDTARSIVNSIDLSTKGGLVWVKGRNDAWDHTLYDTVNGVSIGPLNTATTGAPNPANNQRVTAFNTDGFSLGTNANVNGSTYTYTSWSLRKQPKFFDVVTYTGNGVNGRAISHALGSVPGCIMVKSTSNTSNWVVYHQSLSVPTNKTLRLNTTSAELTSPYFPTTPTSTVFYTNGDGYEVNTTGQTYVAYLFASNAGGFGLTGTDNVVSCGSYTGAAIPNPITLGYEPQFMLIKRTDVSGYDWVMLDTMRGFDQSSIQFLAANLPDAEQRLTNYGFPTATGFAFRGTNGEVNSTTGTYIYIAIRRGPMKVPTLGTSVFSPNASSGSTGTALVTNFPVDLSISTVRSGDYRFVSDRLRGVNSPGLTANQPWIATNNTGAELTNASIPRGWDNTQILVPPYYSGVSSIWWNFGRAPGFFDEVCYTGTGSATTFNHNLTVAPEMVIIKSRSAAYAWPTLVTPIGGTDFLFLDSNSAKNSASSYFNNTYPTSTVFSVGTNVQVNESGSTFVAYLFASAPGVSKVGSYTGNGTTQTINCGFTAGVRFVLIKRYDDGSTGGWYVYDTARGMTVLTDPYLLLNDTAAEAATLGSVTTVSTGFALNSTILAAINVNAGTYIFLAIA